MTRLGLGTFVLLFAASGCTGIVEFEDAKSYGSQTDTLHRVAVLARFDDFKAGFSEEFQREIVSQFLERGVEAKIFIIERTDLDPELAALQVETFDPDALLVLTPTKAVINSDGSIEKGWFVAKLYTDIADKEKAIWATEFTVAMTSVDEPKKTGSKLAQKLIEELSKSKIL